MARFILSCDLFGASFSPADAESKTGLVFSDPVEPGARGRSGRYKGKPTPYGSARLDTSDDAPWSTKLHGLLELLETHIAALRECGAEDIRLTHAYFHDGQCNHEFSPEEMRRIARLEISLCISCYEDDESSTPNETDGAG